MGPPLVCRATTGDVRSLRSGPGDEERPGAVRTGRRTGRVPGWARATTRSSNRPPARVARSSGTFDRTRTCDDQRSWGEQQPEYTPTDDERRRPRGGGAVRPGPEAHPEPARGEEDGVLFQALASSAVRLRVRFGSTGMPGPMVVEMVTFFRYRPLAADGLARSTSSSAAA